MTITNDFTSHMTTTPPAPEDDCSMNSSRGGAVPTAWIWWLWPLHSCRYEDLSKLRKLGFVKLKERCLWSCKMALKNIWCCQCQRFWSVSLYMIFFCFQTFYLFIYLFNYVFIYLFIIKPWRISWSNKADYIMCEVKIFESVDNSKSRAWKQRYDKQSRSAISNFHCSGKTR